MRNPQDVDTKARLLEDGLAPSDTANDTRALLQKQAAERRKGIRRIQYLLVFNVAMGLLLSLVAASFCIKYILFPIVLLSWAARAAEKLLPNASKICGSMYALLEEISCSFCLQAWPAIPLDAPPSSACFSPVFCLRVASVLCHTPPIVVVEGRWPD